MSTLEMVKFWFIKETMPVFLGLGLVAIVFCGAYAWLWIEDITKRVRRK